MFLGCRLVSRFALDLNDHETIMLDDYLYMYISFMRTNLIELEVKILT